MGRNVEAVLGTQLQPALGKVRNILVHGYLAVDIDILHRLLNERLDDFIEFAACIEQNLLGS